MSFYSGSKYEGEMKDGWYHGKGVFIYPSGVQYVGNFYKGQFHGEGTLKYLNGGYYKGVWKHGKKVSGRYNFYDHLKFEEKDWDYCQGKDRRFNSERNDCIKPSGQTQLINEAGGIKHIPQGTYDTGDGFFDPIRSLVYSYDGKKLLRTPNDVEVDWITRKCRYEPRKLENPLTGEEDQIITRVMELQEESRRVLAEKLMKEGTVDPYAHNPESLKRHKLEVKIAKRREVTFIMIKPDGVQRKLIGKTIKRFQRKGFKLLACKLVRPTREMFEKHYSDLKDRSYFKDIIAYMIMGPVCQMVWEGKGVVKTSRVMLGENKPLDSLPGTIRGDSGLEIRRNICHGSDSIKTAKKEIELWFKKEEIFGWDNKQEDLVYE